MPFFAGDALGAPSHAIAVVAFLAAGLARLVLALAADFVVFFGVGTSGPHSIGAPLFGAGQSLQFRYVGEDAQ